MKPFKPITNSAAAVVRERSLSFWQQEFHEADALADAAVEAVADFACQARFSCQADVEAFAVLNQRAFEAEQRRRQCRLKLLHEFCEAVKAAGVQKGGPPW